MSRLLRLCLTALLFSVIASCVTTEMPPPSAPPPGPHDPPHHDHPEPVPPIAWALDAHGFAYDLDVIVGRDEYHIADGGEAIRGRPVSRNSRDVPPGTVSAFEVLLPDGEIDLYWVEEGRPGTLVVYSKAYDALDRRWTRERRLRSINY